MELSMFFDFFASSLHPLRPSRLKAVFCFIQSSPNTFSKRLRWIAIYHQWIPSKIFLQLSGFRQKESRLDGFWIPHHKCEITESTTYQHEISVVPHAKPSRQWRHSLSCLAANKKRRRRSQMHHVVLQITFFRLSQLENSSLAFWRHRRSVKLGHVGANRGS